MSIFSKILKDLRVLKFPVFSYVVSGYFFLIFIIMFCAGLCGVCDKFFVYIIRAFLQA